MDGPKKKAAQKLLQAVMELCADCDICRTMMDEDCAFFIELYRLWDQEHEDGIPVTEEQMRHLIEFCTFCGLCPCPKVPMDIMEAKSLYIEHEGLQLSTRLLNDVPRIARLCSSFPKISRTMQSNSVLGSWLCKAIGLHPERQLPTFPKQNFFTWAANQGLDRQRDGEQRVAYFAGCTAGYMFPEIGRSVVEILQHNGATVYIPPQQCCGMPYLVEGDRKSTLQLAQDNMEQLLEMVRHDYHLVYSCPTCGYFFKKLLKERSYYSTAYQKSVNANEGELKVPAPEKGENQFWHMKKSMYREILKDDGYFSVINPVDRVNLSDHLFDFGIYLSRMNVEGQLATDFTPLPERMVYFAPCHQREQKLGSPYLDLLKLIPKLDIEQVGSDYDCCGMGGVFGFKEHFHQKSLDLGRTLMNKIRAHEPQAIVTDCMSCRLQFNHCLPYPVFHPVEILARTYGVKQS